MSNKFWVGGGSSTSWSATGNTNWSLTSGGSNNAAVPTSSDTAVFDANSGTGISALTANYNVGNVDFTNYTGTFQDGGHILQMGTGSNAAALTLGASMTYTATGTLENLTTGTLTITDLSGTGAISLYKLQASSNGTFSLASALTCNNTFGLSTGTFNTNGYTLAVSSNFTISGGTFNAGASTINLGATFTYTSGTFNAGTSTIAMSNSSSTFAGGGQTYYNLSFSANAAYTLTITGSNTFNNLSATTVGGFNAEMKLTAGTTQTINGTFTVTGNSSTHVMTIISATAGTRANLVVAAASLTFAGFTDTAVTGAAMPLNAYTSTCVNNAHNSGIQFTANYDVIQSTVAASGLASTATSGGVGGSTTALATTTGHMLVAVITENQTGNTWTVSDSATGNNTWVQAVTETNTNQRVDIWYAKNITGNAAEQVVVTSTGVTSDVAIVLYEVVGMDLSSPLDKTMVGATTGTNPTTASSGTLSQADEIVIGGLITSDTNPTNIVQTTGIILIVSPTPAEVSTVYSIAAGYKTTAATTAVTSAFRDTGSATYAIVGATFKYTAAANTHFLTLMGCGT